MNPLACTVLSKIQIKKFNEIAQTEQLADRVQIANKEALVDYMWGRELIDLFLNSLNGESVLRNLLICFVPRLPPLYSIASSLSAHSRGSSYCFCGSV